MRLPAGELMYEPVAYWEEAGQTYEADFLAGRIGHGYERQEARLLALLERLEFTSVLEVGCGFGRITELVARRFPGVPITALDLSVDQLARARARVPDAEFVRSVFQGWRTQRRWDLVLAVEVLMHTPPADVAAVSAKLRRLSSRHVVTVDWTVELPKNKAIAPWNFRHDYAALLGPDALVETVGLQGIHHVEVAP
jgi:trans-aconitate methyltransferase